SPPPRSGPGEGGPRPHARTPRDPTRGPPAISPACIDGLWPDAARRGVSRASFDRYTAGLTPDLRIMDLLDSQPEFTKTFWEYLDILVNDERIQKGREILAQHRATFDAVERSYGVDRHVIVAIW